MGLAALELLSGGQVSPRCLEGDEGKEREWSKRKRTALRCPQLQALSEVDG